MSHALLWPPPLTITEAKRKKIEEKKNSDIPASLNEPRVQSTNQPPHVRNPGCSIRLWIEYSLMARGD